MREALLAAVLSSSLLFPSFAQPQQSPTPAPQPTQLLQSALAALMTTSVTTPISDVTLSGSAHYVAGSDDETGTATLKAISAGASRVDLNLSSGPRSEVLNASATPSAGSWSGPDGVSHAIALHNLMLVDPAWFFPAFPISRGLSSGHLATYIGHETYNSQAVEHLSIIQQITETSQEVSLLQHLSQIDLYLDSSTFMPVAIAYNLHPDNNALLDIPVEIRFSDYRAVNGVQVPFHIQKLINNGLALDLQFTTVTVNTGLGASAFAVQQ